MKKKLITLLAALSLMLGLIPAFGIRANALNTIIINQIKTYSDLYAKLSVSQVTVNQSSDCFIYNTGTENVYGALSKVQLEPGTYWISMLPDCGEVSAAVYDEGVFPVGGDEITADSSGSASGYYEIEEKGTYLFGVKASASQMGQNQSICTQMYIEQVATPAAGGKITRNRVYGLSAPSSKSRTVTVRYKAAATGAITVYESNQVAVTLLSSAGKTIGTQPNQKYWPVFGVKKGVTYKLKLTLSANVSKGFMFYVRQLTKKDQGGLSRAKAVLLKKGVTRSGVIKAGSAQSQWFKIKKTKNKKLKITINGRTNNKMLFKVYKGKKQVKNGKAVFSYKNSSKIATLTGKKGTYYIKVSRGTTTSSGWYSLKWKY